MRILTFTSLFPNREFPHRGIFVENRLRHLLSDTDVESCVVAPVPWFPFSKHASSEYERFYRVPTMEERHGIRVYHPRYFHIPIFGMNLQPFLMAASAKHVLEGLIRDGYDFELIDAHYFYPDGVAATLLGKILKKPVVITARGTDLNLIPQYWVPRQLIKWAARKSDSLITVSNALKDILIGLGAFGSNVLVLRNGVNLQVFKPPKDREALRLTLGMERKTILSVGNLVKLKGHDLVIKAIRKLPGVQLMIVGIGEELDNLKILAQSQGVLERVTFIGAVTQETLKDYYGAADLLVLASSREGWANVLLESMACGTPVVATKVGGTPEVVKVPQAGTLVDRNATAIRESLKKLLDHYPDRNATRHYAEKFSWKDISRGQYQLFTSILMK